jgi:hypothetical protein
VGAPNAPDNERAWSKVWRDLQKNHQELLEEELDIDQRLWDGELAWPHADNWVIPGVILRPDELRSVISKLEKIAK